MYRSMDITDNLKNDILELKKELSAIKNENQLFKVKIRKLQNEVNKKDKQIEALINPDKSFFIKRVVSEKGASMIVSLKDHIKKQEKVINEKEGVIKKLQNDLQTKKLYTLKSADKKRALNVTSSKNHISIPFFENEVDFEDELKSLQSIYKSSSLHNISVKDDEKKSLKRSNRRSVSRDRVESFEQTNVSSNSDVKAQYEGLPRSHLLSIIENLKNNQQKLSPGRNQTDSPDSDIERCELQCETPHPEIQQLQNYFMEILNEVDHLKVTISTLKNEQEKTSSVLKEKDSSIEYLAKEIEFLRKPSCKSNPGSRESMSCLKTQQKLYLDKFGQQSLGSIDIDSLQSGATQSFRSECLNPQQSSLSVEKQQTECENIVVDKEEPMLNLAETRKEKFENLLREMVV